MNRQRAVTAIAGRRRKKKTRKNKEHWLNHRIVLAIKKMKLVGLKQALKPGLQWIERIFWFAVFFACLGIAGYLTVLTVYEYSENPVLNTFREDESISNFPFPATTITGTTILHNNATTDVEGLINKEFEAARNGKQSFQFEGQTWNSRLIDILLFTIDHLCELVGSFATKEEILDSEKVQSFRLRDHLEYAKYMNVTLKDNMDDNALKNTVLPFLKNRTLDCKKIIAACWWEGDQQNCTEVFVATQTDVGSGCTFNRIPEELLRRRQGIISVFNDNNYTKQEIKEWEEFDLDSIISVEGMKAFPTFQNPKVQHEAGKLTGLSFMLIFDEEEGKACPIVDSRGYLIGIHSPFEEPRIMQTGITVPPKTEVFVKVRTEATLADKSIRSLSIARRKCYFQSENPLRNFKYYTVANCHQECLAKEIKDKCECLLLTQSVGKNEILCGPSNLGCVEPTMASIRKKGYDRFCRNPICHSPCTDIKYDADATYLPYYEKGFLDFTGHNMLKKDSVTSIVHITQGSNSVPTRERKLQFTFSVLFGVIGGIWGMILEFSLFTMFNILAGCFALIVPEVLQVDLEDDSDTDPQTTPRRMSESHAERNDAEYSGPLEERIVDTTEVKHPGDTGSGPVPGNATSGNVTASLSAGSVNLGQANVGTSTPIVTISGCISQHRRSDELGTTKQYHSINQSKPASWNKVLFSQRNLSQWNALRDEALEQAKNSAIKAAAEVESKEEYP